MSVITIIIYTASITVTVTDSGTQPVTGQDYSLECNVVGANNFTREWKKNDVVLPQVLQNPVLRFTPFNLSDAGQYTCEVNVKGEIYTDEAFVVKSQSK